MASPPGSGLANTRHFSYELISWPSLQQNGFSSLQLSIVLSPPRLEGVDFAFSIGIVNPVVSPNVSSSRTALSTGQEFARLPHLPPPCAATAAAAASPRTLAAQNNHYGPWLSPTPVPVQVSQDYSSLVTRRRVLSPPPSALDACSILQLDTFSVTRDTRVCSRTFYLDSIASEFRRALYRLRLILSVSASRAISTDNWHNMVGFAYRASTEHRPLPASAFSTEF